MDENQPQSAGTIESQAPAQMAVEQVQSTSSAAAAPAAPTGRQSARMVSVINMKGGVGKTTLSFNLCRSLAAERNKKVLLIDLDPQANATIVSMSEADYKKHRSQKKTIADVFINNIKTYGPVQVNDLPRLEIKDFVHNVYRNSDGGLFDIVPSELMLSSLLKGMTLGPFDLNKLVVDRVKRKYDYILIDCAPTNSQLTTIALNTTGSVLVPMVADMFGSHGTSLMLQVLEDHKEDFGQEISILGVVFTLWKTDEDQVRYSSELIKRWPPEKVFKTKISSDDWYRVSAGISANSAPSTELAEEFNSFTDEFERAFDGAA
jgi:chromosome partitioning protein